MASKCIIFKATLKYPYHLTFFKFSLVTLKSVLKQYDGYFGMDLAILNRCQMTRAAPEMVPSFPNFHATPTGGRLATTYDLACNRPHTRPDRQLNRVSNLEPSGPKAETLPLGHHGSSILQKLD
ncbi:hypothetical protein AVEN_104325-1 [Araneus ventricosus]|uniref:Uncharacterized protein n=1 Tax=Araneus ventricosus TaxID=182803 RepID=A0A4Y2BWX7_ARAVE|nr:hypothetical protein AVEN_104325-1 [Araneus ventricosus]